METKEKLYKGYSFSKNAKVKNMSSENYIEGGFEISLRPKARRKISLSFSVDEYKELMAMLGLGNNRPLILKSFLVKLANLIERYNEVVLFKENGRLKYRIKKTE